MAIRPILIHPDPRLRVVARPVPAVNDPVRALLDDLAETMYAARGIGLAATQVGVARRLVVMDCCRDDEGEEEEKERDTVFLVNPEIVERSESTAERDEGCLSIPEVYEPVTRPVAVTARYLDRDGRAVEREFQDLQAVCLQHEVDHLDGKLFIDYLGPVKRRLITNRMRKWKREQKRESEG